LDEAIDKDLHTVLAQNLFELKTFINYDLRLDKPESDAVFWNFMGNPLYRLVERSIVENCRSKKYRERFFEKINALIKEIRPDKELLREREERAKTQSKEKSLRAGKKGKLASLVCFLHPVKSSLELSQDIPKYFDQLVVQVRRDDTNNNQHYHGG
jgi:CRISPR/Cas system-associated endonuclease/helicase Cas3